MKKGMSSLFVWLIFGGIFLILIVVTALIITNQDTTKTKKQFGIESMDVYLMAKDSNYKSSLKGKYIIDNQTNYLKGNIVKDSFTEIKNVSNNITLGIYCSSEGFYSFLNESYRFSEQEKKFNSSKVYCELDKIGQVELSTRGKLKDGESEIDLIILGKGYYKNIELCVAWTPGIINLNTIYEETEKPFIYKTITDKCYYLNQSLKDDYLEIPFKVKSKNLNKLDAITFYVMDNDYYFDDGFKLDSLVGDKNLGNPEDSILVLRYLN